MLLFLWVYCFLFHAIVFDVKASGNMLSYCRALDQRHSSDSHLKVAATSRKGLNRNGEKPEKDRNVEAEQDSSKNNCIK